MFDAVLPANPVKGMSPEQGCWPIAVLWPVGKLDAVVRKNRFITVLGLMEYRSASAFMLS
jgi:hypothetical protein